MGLFGIIEEGAEESSKFYEGWNKEVIRTVPEDRLLIFNVKQGWKPLCDFLNLPVPATPFPHVNDMEEFQKRIKAVKVCGFLLVYMLPVAVATSAVYFTNFFAALSYLM